MLQKLKNSLTIFSLIKAQLMKRPLKKPKEKPKEKTKNHFSNDFLVKKMIEFSDKLSNRSVI